MKILVLTSPRTASSWFCKHLSKLHNVINYSEIVDNTLHDTFDKTLTDDLGSDGLEDLYKDIKQKQNDLPAHLYGLYRNKLNMQLSKTTSGIFKLMRLQNVAICPEQVPKEYQQLQRTLLDNHLASADKVYVLIRRDTNAQVKSGMCANFFNHWGINLLSERTINITVSQQDYDEKYQFTLEKNKRLIQYANQINAEIVYTEDIVQSDFNRYPQQYNFIIK